MRVRITKSIPDKKGRSAPVGAASPFPHGCRVRRKRYAGTHSACGIVCAYPGFAPWVQTDNGEKCDLTPEWKMALVPAAEPTPEPARPPIVVLIHRALSVVAPSPAKERSEAPILKKSVRITVRPSLLTPDQRANLLALSPDERVLMEKAVRESEVLTEGEKWARLGVLKKGATNSRKSATNCRIPYSDEQKTTRVLMHKAVSSSAVVYLVSHGESTMNKPTDRITGWKNPSLDADGRKQGDVLAARLQKLGIRRIVTSDLKRAHETADIIGKRLGLKVEADEVYRPQKMGTFEGQTSESVRPKMADYVLKTPDKPVPGGESYHAFAKPFLAALKKLVDGARETTVLVTHSRNLALAAATQGGKTDGKKYLDHDVETGAILKLTRSAGGWKAEWMEEHTAIKSVRIRKAVHKGGWIGVDLDGVLAEYHGDISTIGAPVPAMLARVKRWLASGKEVRIFTARVADDPGGRQKSMIEAWCKENMGQALPVTCTKDRGMVKLFDDRAVGVVPNKGTLVRARRAS